MSILVEETRVVNFEKVNRVKNRNISYTRLSPIPESLIVEAEQRARSQRVYDYSHRKEEANGIGCLGEVIFEQWLQHNEIDFEVELERTTHDYRVQGLTIDVKTKDRTVVPLLHYDNSAPLYNHSHQKPDYFFFISLKREKNDDSFQLSDFHSAYLVGSISYEELDEIGIPFFAGEKDWRNQTKFWTDCLNVEMWQLIPIRETLEIFRGQRCKPSSYSAINKKLVLEMKAKIDCGLLRKRIFPLDHN